MSKPVILSYSDGLEQILKKLVNMEERNAKREEGGCPINAKFGKVVEMFTLTMGMNHTGTSTPTTLLLHSHCIVETTNDPLTMRVLIEPIPTS